MEPGIVLGLVLAVLLVLSVPIAMSLGLASLAAILVMSTDFLIFLPQKFISGIDSFTLLAIPLFILAGTIMGEGGIAHRIIDHHDENSIFNVLNIKKHRMQRMFSFYFLETKFHLWC